jgi:hypothetical protein
MDLEYKIEICYENFAKEKSFQKQSCMKIILTMSKVFLKNNEENIKCNYLNIFFSFNEL